MGDRGFSRVPLTKATTEWDEALMKHGVVNRYQVLRAKGFTDDGIREILKDEAAEQKEKEREEAALFAVKPHPGEGATLEELDRLEEDLDDDAAIAKYREQRVREMVAERSRHKFGTIAEIDRDAWMTEVNDASRDHFVVVHLYQDYVPDCKKMDDFLETIATGHRDVKFLKIRSRSAIENWPDKKLPVLFIYRHGELQHQLFGRGRQLSSNVTAKDIDDLLKDSGVFGATASSSSEERNHHNNDSDDDVDLDDHERRRRRGLRRRDPSVGLYNDPLGAPWDKSGLAS